MYKHFYLNRSHIYFVGLGLFFIWLLDFYFAFWLVGSTFFISLFFVRRLSSTYTSDLSSNIKSPIAGLCTNISEKGNQASVEFRISPWNDYGIRMPVSGKILLNSDSTIKIADFRDKEISMTICPVWSRKLQNWSKEGDQVQENALLGIMPFGGKLILKFNRTDYHFMLQQNQKVFFGQSILTHKEE